MAGSDPVADAIRNAAMRAERHAHLNSAVTSMEELLNIPLPPEQLPWGLAMSKSYFSTLWHWYEKSNHEVCLHDLYCISCACAMCAWCIRNVNHWSCRGQVAHARLCFPGWRLDAPPVPAKPAPKAKAGHVNRSMFLLWQLSMLCVIKIGCFSIYLDWFYWTVSTDLIGILQISFWCHMSPLQWSTT